MSLTRSISSIGRIPAIASFEKGKAKATAPSNLPSMYTGLPLIALHHAGVFQRSAGKFRQNQVLFRADVLERPQNLHLEFLDLVAAEHSSAYTVKTGLNVADVEEGGWTVGWYTDRY